MGVVLYPKGNDGVVNYIFKTASAKFTKTRL